MASSSLVEVEAVITGSRPMPAYGGVQLSDEVLETIAAALRAREVPMVLYHNPLRPLRAEVIDAQVRPTADGFKEVWVNFVVDDAQWRTYEEEVAAASAPGGFSFSCSEPLAELPAVDGAVGHLDLAADAAHWSDTDLLGAAEALRTLGRVSVGRRYEFSFEPAAVVVLTLIVLPLAINVLSSVLYDALKRLTRPEGSSIFHFRIHRDGAVVEARLETDREDVLQRALGAFDQLSSPVKPHGWNDERAQWLQIDDDAVGEPED